MISKKDVKKINDYLWEIPRSFRNDMRVPARFYSSEKMFEDAFEDKSLSQLVNTTTLPGIVRHALAMPDMHQGYGMPIGGVIATKLPRGVISPGAIGYDENCGVRLLKSKFEEKEVRGRLDQLARKMQSEVPSGLGEGRSEKLSLKALENILEKGVPYLAAQGYAIKEDVKNCEQGGAMQEADARAVSDKAKKRGRDQVGTLGSGNHFLEIQVVDEIFDEETAEKFGLEKGQVTVMIHTGSRGFGHQNCTDYLKVAREAMNKYNISLPDRQLACMPFNSSEGQRFFKALSCACNFAWCNRQTITYYVRKAWSDVFGSKIKLPLLYDVAHNIAKVEEYEVEGNTEELCVHRKGATRAFPPGHSELPAHWQKTGQPVLIPGSMGTSSYVLAGTKGSEETFYSTCHGAGRTMSRTEAKKRVSGKELVEDLKRKGVLVKCYSMRGVAEEAPLAYKNVDDVVEVVHGAGLAERVVRLRPLAVIKGE